MSQQTVTIHLNTTAQTGGINTIVAGLGHVKNAAEGVNGWLLRAAASVAGMAAGIVGVTSLGSAVGGAIEKGVKFNVTLEDSKLGIAAILKQFNPQAFLNFDDALKASGAALDELKKKAVESPASFSQLVSGFQAITGAATGAGVKLKDQIDLVVLLSQALAGLGIRSDQLIQESRALITGNIDKNAAVARMLQITPQEINAAREQGRLFEFLRDKLAAFSEAGKIGATNFSTAISNLGDVIEQKLGTITVPIFEAIKEGVLRLNTAINETDMEGAFSGWSDRIASVVSGLLTLGKIGVENIRVLIAAVEALTLAITILAARAGLALGANLIPHLTAAAAWFGTVNAAVAATSVTAGKLAATAAAFKSATGAASVFLAAFAGWKAGTFLGELDLLGKGLGDFGVKVNDLVTFNILKAMKVWEQFKLSIGQGSPAKVAAIEVSIQEILAPDRRKPATAAEVPPPVKRPELVDTLEHQRLLLEQNRTRISIIEKELTIDAAERSEELRAVYEERATMITSLQAQISKAAGEGFGTSDDGQIRFTREYAAAAKDLNALLLEQAEIRATISKMEQEDSQRQIEEIDRQMDSKELSVQQLRTPGAKLPDGGTVGSLAEESAAIKQNLAQMQLLIAKREEVRKSLAASDNPEVVGEASKMELENARARLQVEQDLLALKEQTNDFSFVERMKAGLTELGEEFNNVGAAIADTLVNGIRSAIDTVSQGMWQVIDGTATWRDLFVQVGRDIISSLVQIGIQELVLDNLKRGLMTAWAALKTLFLAKDVTASNAAEAAKTPALVANATLASVSSWGLAVVVGIAALAAVLATVGAFEKGGVVAGGEQIIRVNERGTEAVLNARATSMLGPDTINRLNAGMIGAMDLEQRVATYVEPPTAPDATPTGFVAPQRGTEQQQSSGYGGYSERPVTAAASEPQEQRPVNISVIVVDNQQALLDAIESSAGQAKIVHVIRNNKTEIGIS